MSRPESGHKDFVVKTDAPVTEEWTKKEMVSRKHLDDRKSEVYAEELKHGYTPELTLRAMDVEGIDVAILFRTFAQMAIQVDGQDPGYTFAVCRAFNNWLHEFASVDEARLKGSGILALTDVSAAVVEAREVHQGVGDGSGDICCRRWSTTGWCTTWNATHYGTPCRRWISQSHFTTLRRGLRLRIQVTGFGTIRTTWCWCTRSRFPYP